MVMVRFLELLAERPNLGYAVAFHAICIVCTVFVALRPALDGGSWLTAAGMALGWVRAAADFSSSAG